MGLAEYLARRFSNRGEPIEDLIQVALLGLLKAVERFDPSRGLEFSTFATPTIVGELKRHFRDKGWAVRVPRRVQELHLRMGSVVNALSQELGRSPTIPEIARHGRGVGGRGPRGDGSRPGLPVQLHRRQPAATTRSARPAGRRPARHGRAGPGGGGAPLMLSPAAGQSLPKREQMIIQLRFFRGMTQSEIAARLGISQMHVSRLLARSLNQLRERAGAETEP